MDFPYIVVVLGIVGLIMAVIYWFNKKRKEELGAAARSLGFSFSPPPDKELLGTLSDFNLCRRGHSQKAKNIMKGAMMGIRWTIFDYQYTEGYGKNSRTSTQTVACAHLDDADLPKFSLEPEHFFHKIGDVFGFKDIDFSHSPAFSKKYHLKSNNEAGVRSLFASHVLRFFENRKKTANIEASRSGAGGSRIIIFNHGKRVNPKDLYTFIKEATDIALLFARSRY